MASKLSMISGAAVRLGAEPVISLDEGSKAATTGGNLYDSTVESLLAMHRWRFATGKKALSLLSDTPLNEWLYAWQLPTNPKVMTIIRVYPQQIYERFEDKLYTNQANACEIDYVYKPSEDNWTTSFVEMVEVKLAMEMAVSVTGSRTLRDTLKLDFAGNSAQPGVMQLAMAADSRERPPAAVVDSPFTSVRR
jgi:hypothetical protein|tara:strand:- start:584 stop:1162 length:579 start_codon:yes stop_codon:yes gene_type:complete